MSASVNNTPEAMLFQAVIHQAVSDALGVRSDAGSRQEQYRSDRWLRGMSLDFVTVCSLAGMDPEFVRDAYVSGKFKPDDFITKSRQGKRS